MNSARLSFWKLGYAGSILLILISTVPSKAQSPASVPIKQGLWQTQITTSMQMTLSPEMEARIAAMPAAQQTQMRSMMGGPAAKPSTSTYKSCAAGTMSVNDLLNQAEQKGGTKCTFANRQQSGSTVSFDVSCTSQQGTASGHVQFTITDSDNATSTTHMSMSGGANAQAMSVTIDSTSTYKYMGADCGDVKPNTTQ